MTYGFGALLLALTLGSIVYRRVRRSPGDTGRALARDLFAGAAVFAFVGPGVGMIVVAAVMTAAVRSMDSLMMALYGLPWSYIYGLVPALLCGMTAGALKPAAPSWRANLRMGAVGALYGFAFMLMFVGRDMAWRELGFPLVVGALPGAAGAVVAARVFYGKQTIIRSSAEAKIQ